MRSLIALVCLSGCAAAQIETGRDYNTTPRGEARWIITSGLGEIALGAAASAMSLYTLQHPTPREPTAGPSDPAGDLADGVKEGLGLLFVIFLGGAVAVVGGGDVVLGLYQLAVDRYVLGEAPE